MRYKIIFLLMLFLIGCGTLTSPSTTIYGGVRLDIALIRGDALVWNGPLVPIICIIDIPFSLVLDTLFVPIYIYN